MKNLPAAALAAMIAIALALGAEASSGAGEATANSQETHKAMSRADTNCPRTQVAARFRDTVLASNGELEPIHTRDGLAVLATAETAEGIERVRAAARSYLQESQQLIVATAASNAQSSASCTEILGAIGAGTVRETAADTEEGVLVSISTTDARLIDLLQRSNCCQFCVCPSTNHRCSGCC